VLRLLCVRRSFFRSLRVFFVTARPVGTYVRSKRPLAVKERRTKAKMSDYFFYDTPLFFHHHCRLIIKHQPLLLSFPTIKQHRIIIMTSQLCTATCFERIFSSTAAANANLKQPLLVEVQDVESSSSFSRRTKDR
jgi:hypothetical protein